MTEVLTTTNIVPKFDLQNLNNIADELKRQNSWVAWRGVWIVDKGKQKLDKKPYSVKTGRPGGQTTPSLWVSFEEAVKVIGRYDGLGFAFGGNDIIGIDIDKCFIDGHFSKFAQDIVDKLDSYTEISPSGKGLHIFARGNINLEHKRKDLVGLEIYQAGRFFTITGNIYGERKPVNERTNELQLVYDAYLAEKPKQNIIAFPQSPGNVYSKGIENSISDDEYVKIGLEKDDILKNYYYGARPIGNESQDDMGFISKLAYWANGNINVIKDTFLNSPYFTQKDEPHKKKCERKDYLETRTIPSVLSSLTTTARQDDERFKDTQPDSNGNKIIFENQPLLDCGAWTVDESGIWKTVGENKVIYACRHPIYISRILVNQESKQEKVEIKYKRRNKWKTGIYDKSIIANKTKIVTKLPLDGIGVTSENAGALVAYLNDLEMLNEDIIPVCDSVSSIGWHDNKFLPYDCNKFVFDGTGEFKDVFDSIKSKGNVQEWIQFVKELRKNPVVRAVTDASFASVMLEQFNQLPFIMHIHGKTGTGKTVTLMVAASIWGNPSMGKYLRSLNNTQNYTLKMNIFLKNLPFIGDELQTIKNYYDGYDKFIMTVTEGSDRGRLRADSSVDVVYHWRNSMIFSGEDPITANNSGGGTKNRVIEIDVSDMRIIEDGVKTVDFLKNNYGHAGKLFVDALRRDNDYKSLLDDAKKEYLKSTEEKQAASMAAVYVADCIAAKFIFNEQIIDIKTFSDFLRTKQDVDVSERAYEWVLDWAAANDARFRTVLEDNNGECYGKKDVQDNSIYINYSTLDAAMLKNGYSLDAIKKEWLKKGYMIPDKKNRPTHHLRINKNDAKYVKLSQKSFDDYD